MTIFNPDTPNIDRRLQDVENKEVRSVLGEKGYSDAEINYAIRNMHLNNAINRLEDILCERKEIFEILLDDGWEKEEIEEAFKHRSNN